MKAGVQTTLLVELIYRISHDLHPFVSTSLDDTIQDPGHDTHPPPQNQYKNKYHKPCRVKKGRVCGRGWRKVATFGKGYTQYRSCRRKQKAETFHKLRNAYNSTTFLVNAYKIYFKRISRGARMVRLPAKLRRKYQKYYAVDLSRISIGFSSRAPARGITDCYKIYFKHSTNMLNQVRDTVFSGPKNERLFLHELAHSEQCYRQGGRNNYAKMWFKHLGVRVLKTIKNKKKLNKEHIHDHQPMESAAQSKANRIQRQVKNNRVGRSI